MHCPENHLFIESIPFNLFCDETLRKLENLPYARVKDQLNSDKGCVLKANRVIVPIKLKDKVMKMLHSEHMGILKTKNLARYYVWWPKIDEDIETLVKSCEPCELNRNVPDKHSSHSLQYPAGPRQHIHIDIVVHSEVTCI